MPCNCLVSLSQAAAPTREVVNYMKASFKELKIPRWVIWQLAWVAAENNSWRVNEKQTWKVLPDSWDVKKKQRVTGNEGWAECSGTGPSLFSSRPSHPLTTSGFVWHCPFVDTVRFSCLLGCCRQMGTVMTCPARPPLAGTVSRSKWSPASSAGSRALEWKVAQALSICITAL